MIAGGGVCNHFNVKGFRFQPTDEELVEYHLNPKILDPDSDRHYIGDIKDLSQLEPSELFRKTQKNPDDKEGYFFCSPTYTNDKKDRISRTVEHGSWAETRRWVPVSIDSGEKSLIAKKRVFVFHKGDYPGIRTNWFIYEFELTISHPIHQDKTKIFVCKLFKNDRRSGSKRKRGDNVQETSAKLRTAKKGNSLRKKAKVSSAQVAQLDDDHDNNNNDNNNHIMSCEVVHGSQSLTSDLDSSIITGVLTPQSHHLSSKYFSSSNMPEGGHYRSTGGLHPSNGFPGDIQSFDDNQSHHLSSNSINSISTGVGMQPSHYFPSSTPEENLNEDPQYNEQRKEESQLSFQLPLDPKNDIISSGLLQQSHHRLPSNCEERIDSFDAYEKSQPKLPTQEGGSLECMDEDAKYYEGFSVEELLAQLPPQPPTTAEDHGCNELPPITDVSRGSDQLQDQRGSNEEDDASFWASLPQLY